MEVPGLEVVIEIVTEMKGLARILTLDPIGPLSGCVARKSMVIPSSRLDASFHIPSKCYAEGMWTFSPGFSGFE